jgi:hypothetical protein
MPGEKAEKLRDIAPIGIERLVGHPPLGVEIAEPAADFG